MELEVNKISGVVVDAAYKVLTNLGPGLLEGEYEACLAHKLRSRGYKAPTQVTLPVFYEGERIELGYRLDMLVEERVIVELKTVEKLMPIHKAQLLSYLKLSGVKIGLLLNFKTESLRDGIIRMAL